MSAVWTIRVPDVDVLPEDACLGDLVYHQGQVRAWTREGWAIEYPYPGCRECGRHHNGLRHGEWLRRHEQTSQPVEATAPAVTPAEGALRQMMDVPEQHEDPCSPWFAAAELIDHAAAILSDTTGQRHGELVAEAARLRDVGWGVHRRQCVTASGRPPHGAR